MLLLFACKLTAEKASVSLDNLHVDFFHGPRLDVWVFNINFVNRRCSTSTLRH